MKYTFALAALTAFVAAQSIADLPSCSLTCLLEGVAGIGCSTTDFSCSCPKAAELTPPLTTCVEGACSNAADQAKVLQVLGGLCSAAGYPIDAAPSTSAAPESSATPTVSSAAPESTEKSLSSFDLTPSQTPTPTGSVSHTPVAPSGSGVSSGLPEFTGAAAAVKIPAAFAGVFGLAAFVL